MWLMDGDISNYFVLLSFGGLISFMAIRHGLKLRAERDRREG